MTQVLYLEQYRLSQEAAKSFDDDLDFCPSLTAKELSEIILASILAQKENQAKQGRASSISSSSSSSTASSPTTPASTLPPSRAIKIVDPDSRKIVDPYTGTSYIPPYKTQQQPGRYSSSVSSTPTVTSNGSSDSYFNLFPSASRQKQQQQQQQQQSQMFGGMYGSYQFTPQLQQQQHQQQFHAYSMGMTSPTMGAYSPPRSVSRIPIVNPDNGSIVALPEASSASSSASWHQNHFVAVR